MKLLEVNSVTKKFGPLVAVDNASMFINENEIDGIPNRKIECTNLQEFSLRTTIYLISQEEADILRTHEKIESVQLNPDKYPIEILVCP